MRRVEHVSGPLLVDLRVPHAPANVGDKVRDRSRTVGLELDTLGCFEQGPMTGGVIVRAGRGAVGENPSEREVSERAHVVRDRVGRQTEKWEMPVHFYRSSVCGSK